MPKRFPTPDLVERLTGFGGRVDPGLFARNYYRGDNRKRKRGGGGGDPISRAIALLHELYRNSVLNVRTPSHIAPPFRAEQFTFQAVFSVTLGAAEQVIAFNGNPSIAEGVNGVVSFINVTWGSQNRDVLSNPWAFGGGTPALFTFKKNGSTIPGLGQLKPAYTFGEALNDIAGTNIVQGTIPFPFVVPIQLKAGDVMSVAYNGFGGAVGDAAVQVAGYTYPIEVESDGIRGTLADRL